ncbi:MAG TPA: DNA mismatch repair protein [Puia sp.]|jgi:DNA mismatch repair ATPase MutS|nr:DNA mismatch repair protein [Puia sp.]
MPFITDKQTLTDLNMLGKYKTGSIFNLFNRVKTRGGELLLENMFIAPLADAQSINERAAHIQYLQELDITLEINRDSMDLASQYFTERRPSNRLSAVFNNYREKMQEVLYRSQSLLIHQKQIDAVQKILLAGSLLLGQLQKKEKSENPCKALQDQLGKIINDPALKQLRARYPFTVQQTAQCQYLFLNVFREDIQRLFQLLYEMDVYISVAKTARERNLVYARAMNSNGEHFHIEDLRHPTLSGAIGNSITLNKEQNLLFLTGANMAGKSTWMKTLGISFYLAHMGFPVAAALMNFSVMEGIFTSINVPDDISLGWSHFYAEVMRVKLVAKEVSSGKKLFVLFDELFKGTNVKDAYDATLVVTQKLARYTNCAFVISTHIIEVGEALKDKENIQFQYMPTLMKGAVPQYTYRLADGITEDRQGMIIIENEKILEMLKPKTREDD